MKVVLRTIRSHCTYANVGVTICLIAVLGSGTALAAARWGSADIINNSLRSIDIRNNEVASSDIRNNSVTATDLRAATRASLTDTSPWETIPSGVTVRGAFFEDYPIVGPSEVHVRNVQLPAVPPEAFAAADVNFAADADPNTIDDSALCTGSASNPTAPPGKVCAYLTASANAVDIEAHGWASADYRAMGLFYIEWNDAPTVALGDNATVFGTWAYTAP